MVEEEVFGMGHTAQSAHVGCRVLPICESGMGRSFHGSERGDWRAEEKIRKSTVDAVKELLKWASATKPPADINGGKAMTFQHESNPRVVKDKLTMANPSKFRLWWVSTGSCVAAPCMRSPTSMVSSQSWAGHATNPNHVTFPSSDDGSGESCLNDAWLEERERRAHWITTDSDFVVLEL